MGPSSPLTRNDETFSSGSDPTKARPLGQKRAGFFMASKCTRLSRILRTLKFERTKKLSKGEKKIGRKATINRAVGEIVKAEPVVFVPKAKFDQERKRSIREMADELYRQDHGGG